jgi:hypothetical protein
MGIKMKLIGQRDIEVSDLEVYLNNRVAIGEHPDIGVEIEKKIETIDGLQSRIDTIDRLTPPQPVSGEAEKTVESE